jgi:hypothetical protein
MAAPDDIEIWRDEIYAKAQAKESNGAQERNQPVRVRHRHEDFQSGLYFSNLIKSVAYALSISICASK